MGWLWHEKRKKKNLVMNLEYFNLNKYVELVVFLMRGLLLEDVFQLSYLELYKLKIKYSFLYVYYSILNLGPSE